MPIGNNCTSHVVVPEPTKTDIIEMQGQATLAEQTMWGQRGAKPNEDGLWTTDNGLLVAPTTLLTSLISEAHGLDHCARREVIRKVRKDGFWSSYLQASVDHFLSRCEVCVQNNVRKGITTSIGHRGAIHTFGHRLCGHAENSLR